jgi:negative regulator of sigma E activity
VAVPWLKIVGLVPSILDVSRELLKRSKRFPAAGAVTLAGPSEASALGARVEILENNERRQAELISQMAEQNAALVRALTTLHTWLVRLAITTAAAVLLAVIALGLALAR